MTITNGYCTLAQVKNRLNPVNLQTQATDDGVIEDLITSNSRWIDRSTHRTFYARTQTNSYDVPDNPYRLTIDDDDLLTITTLTNGDGTVITSSHYKLYPLNTSPKYEIVLLPSSGYVWEPSTAGNFEAAITVVGEWGYTATYPANINEVCIQITMDIYQGRYAVPDQAMQDPDRAYIKKTLDSYMRWTPS